MCIFVFLFFLNDVFFFYLPWNMSFITDFAQLSWEFLFLSERITTLSWNKECLHSLSNKVKFNLCFLLSVHRSFLGDLLRVTITFPPWPWLMEQPLWVTSNTMTKRSCYCFCPERERPKSTSTHILLTKAVIMPKFNQQENTIPPCTRGE